MRFLTIIFLLSIAITGFSQRSTLAGNVQDATSTSGLIGVHIINLTSDKLAVSGPDGDFQLPVQTGDTVIVSHVGYKNEEFIFSNDFPKEFIISLEQETTELEEVQVTILPEYWRFKQLVLDTQPMDSSFVVFGLDAIPKDLLIEKPANQQPVVPPGLNPPSVGVRFGFDGLTKKAKEKKKLQKILARQELSRTASLKFNRKWVAQETGLEGDELTNFIAYCDFSIEFIVQTPLYDIHKEMMALLTDFKKDQLKSNTGDNRFTPGA